jgi:hypothetical protein
MLVSNGILAQRYDQHHQPGMYLGRHLELDGRSLAFLTEKEPELAVARIKPAEYVCPLPILNQGNLGSCTGHAGAEALAALYPTNFADLVLAGHKLGNDAEVSHQFALEVYHQATQNDPWEGVYPPEDTGSSGLAVCRSLKKGGLIGRYTWSLTLHAIALGFQRRGHIIGMPWLNAMFEPDNDGFIDHDPRWLDSGVAGGHEIYWEALEAWDDHDPAKVIFRFRQSWGGSWGDAGYGRMRGSSYVALQSQIDVKQFVPLAA